jgi:hypothetical protein
MDGKFISKYAYKGAAEDTINLKMVWSGYYQGYFFIKYSEQGNRLLFWDPEVITEGENLQFDSEGQKEEPSKQMAALRERADRLNKTYGVDIRLGDECELDYSHYTSYCFENAQSLTEALDVLEECLSKYPKGFFNQLQYGAITSIRIELVGGLSPKEGTEGVLDAAAFAQEKHDYYLLVFDADLFMKTTVYHEITHIIDNRLAWDALFDKKALFSEKEWLKQQPKGFDYAYSSGSVYHSFSIHCLEQRQTQCNC